MQPERRTLTVAQVEQYKGKLGFEHRSEEKLTLALSELVDTLEEFGHPPLQIHARESYRITLESDQFKSTLRLRRIPLRLGVRTPKAVPVPGAYIEVALVPNFPEACDREITEILLAMILKRMTEALDPLLVFWQDTAKALTSKEFLSAFTQSEPEIPEPLAPSPAIVVQEKVEDLHQSQADIVIEQAKQRAAKPADPSAPKETWSPAMVLEKSEKLFPAMSSSETRLWKADQARAEAEEERARGQALFGSVDEASPVLERHCDEIEQQRSTKLTSRFRRKRKPQSSYQTIFGNSRLDWVLAVPRALVSAPANLLRSADLVLSVRAVITAMVVLFLHGSGMVQAAARAFLP